jgi:ribosomal protein S18 acetylase RimI-like enzyme
LLRLADFRYRFLMVQQSIGDRSRDDPRDNPVWHSLRGPLSRFVAPSSTSELIRFDPEVSPFGAVDKIDAGGWKRIAELVGSEGVCGLFRDVVPTPPAGWEELYRGPCYQMMAGDLPSPEGFETVSLGVDEAGEMLSLAERTEPGPFSLRTFELGRFVGIRREGRLVAMAGERFRMPGYVEISAVCTHPDVRGEGLATELTLNAAASIRAGGDEAMLHVLETNENAVRLYQKIGFVIRRKIDVVFGQWHYPDWKPPTA